MSFYRFFQLLLVAASVLSFLVWGLPGLLRVGPQLCARWHLSTGICGEKILESLRRLDRWSERVLRPYSRDVRLERALEKAYAALRTLEGTARKGVGDERVDSALRGADIALNEIEEIINSGKTQEKFRDVPENAQKLIQDAREALDRLRDVLGRAERRAEDVGSSVNNLRKALDVLSNVLPKRE